jgi:hypothetical protein
VGSLHCIDSGSLIFVRPGVYATTTTPRILLMLRSSNPSVTSFTLHKTAVSSHRTTCI